MFRKLLSVVLVVAMLAVVPVVMCGCEEPSSIDKESTTTVQHVPANSNGNTNTK